MAGDIALKAIFGKPEMPDLRGLKAAGTERRAHKSTFQRLVDCIVRKAAPGPAPEPGLKQAPPYNDTVLKTEGEPP